MEGKLASPPFVLAAEILAGTEIAKKPPLCEHGSCCIVSFTTDSGVLP